MYSYQPDDFLREAIEKGNIDKIWGALVTILQSDPTFQTHELDSAIDYANSKISFWAEKNNAQFPINTDKFAWDEDYFATAVTYLRHNFTKERLAHVKEVSLATHQDLLARQEAKKVVHHTPATTVTQHGTQPNPFKGHRKILIILIAGLVLLVALIILLVKCRPSIPHEALIAGKGVISNASMVAKCVVKG